MLNFNVLLLPKMEHKSILWFLRQAANGLLVTADANLQINSYTLKALCKFNEKLTDSYS